MKDEGDDAILLLAPLAAWRDIFQWSSHQKGDVSNSPCRLDETRQQQSHELVEHNA